MDKLQLVGYLTDAEYYVKIIDSKTIKLFPKEGDSITGSNAVSLSSNGVGVHRFESFDKKRVISDVIVISSGSNYENKERTSGITGIKYILKSD